MEGFCNPQDTSNRICTNILSTRKSPDVKELMKLYSQSLKLYSSYIREGRETQKEKAALLASSVSAVQKECALV